MGQTNGSTLVFAHVRTTPRRVAIGLRQFFIVNVSTVDELRILLLASDVFHTVLRLMMARGCCWQESRQTFSIRCRSVSCVLMWYNLQCNKFFMLCNSLTLWQTINEAKRLLYFSSFISISHSSLNAMVHSTRYTEMKSKLKTVVCVGKFNVSNWKLLYLRDEMKKKIYFNMDNKYEYYKVFCMNIARKLEVSHPILYSNLTRV